MFTYYLFSFVFGSVVGSSLDCLCERILEEKDWIRGRSRCDHCGHALYAWNLIPIISYVKQKGRCPYCGKKIDRRYFIVEMITGIVFLLITYVHHDDILLLIRDWGLCSILLCISLIDIRIYEIPDDCILLGIAWFFIFACIQKDIDLYNIVFACFMFVILDILACALEKITQKECFGGGDLKMIFMVDLYLGYPRGIAGLMTACLLACIAMMIQKKKMLAFAPYISAGVILSLLFHEQILWYCGRF